jgi:hypothetical protein
MFHNIAQCRDFDDGEWYRVYFSRHPPWENEQLACVHRYLGTMLDQGSLADDNSATTLLL